MSAPRKPSRKPRAARPRWQLVRLVWKPRFSKERRAAIAAEIATRYGYECRNHGDSLFLLAEKQDTKPIWLFMLHGNWSAIR